MPERLIHCQSCRALLNPDLEVEHAPIPEFEPLPELECMVDAHPKGYFVHCSACDRELRVASRFRGMRLSCKFCDASFDFDPARADERYVAFQVACPHCRRDLRASWKYLGSKLICKHCSGQLRLVNTGEPSVADTESNSAAARGD